MSYPVLVLWLNAIAFGLFGLAFIFSPNKMSALTTDVEPGSDSARTDIRSTYGGCMLALGLWFGGAAVTGAATQAALILVLLIMVGMASSRLLGMASDGNSNGYIKLALGAEILMAGLSAAAL